LGDVSAFRAELGGFREAWPRLELILLIVSADLSAYSTWISDQKRTSGRKVRNQNENLVKPLTLLAQVCATSTHMHKAHSNSYNWRRSHSTHSADFPDLG